jgi:hypothetical protein
VQRVSNPALPAWIVGRLLGAVVPDFRKERRCAEPWWRYPPIAAGDGCRRQPLMSACLLWATFGDRIREHQRCRTYETLCRA